MKPPRLHSVSDIMDPDVHPRRRMKVLAIPLWSTVLTIVLAGPAAANQPLDIRVLHAGSNVTIQAFIDPDERNRAVEFIIDSDRYFAGSTQDLNGQYAPRVKEVTFRELPAGEYAVRVNLLGGGGGDVRHSAGQRFVLW